jgi:DNA repair protein REV1
MSHADDLQAVSVDEALVDVTTSVAQLTAKHPSNPDPAKEFAEMIRLEVKKATGCEGELFAHLLLRETECGHFVL